MNSETEWEFIEKQIHREKPTRENTLKRELLFSLQLLLANISDEKDVTIYRKTKKFYSTFN